MLERLTPPDITEFELPSGFGQYQFVERLNHFALVSGFTIHKVEFDQSPEAVVPAVMKPAEKIEWEPGDSYLLQHGQHGVYFLELNSSENKRVDYFADVTKVPDSFHIADLKKAYDHRLARLTWHHWDEKEFSELEKKDVVTSQWTDAKLEGEDQFLKEFIESLQAPTSFQAPPDPEPAEE